MRSVIGGGEPKVGLVSAVEGAKNKAFSTRGCVRIRGAKLRFNVLDLMEH